MSQSKLSIDIFSTLADQINIAILVFTKDLKCSYLNIPALDLLELPHEQNLDQIDIKSLMPNATNDRRVKMFEPQLLETPSFYQELLVKKTSGRNFYAQASIKPFMADGKPMTLITLQDVTLQKKLQREITEKQSAIHQAYQELLEQNKQLKDLDVAKNKFIAVTTHELRTPLSAMVASAEILTMKLYDDDKQRDEFTQVIHQQGLHMLNLVNDILDFAKIQAGKMDYYVEERDLFELMKHQAEALTTMADQVKVKIHIEPPPQECKCYFDSLRMNQVVANLLNNAIKYNRENGSVNLKIQDSGEHYELHITDTGKGIAPEDHKKVFNEFETLGKSANHSKGTGLGLPISQKMIQAMGGDIYLKSEIGVGSNFWITVPKNRVLPEENYRSRPDLDGDLAA